jgi:hypothetical protein
MIISLARGKYFLTPGEKVFHRPLLVSLHEHESARLLKNQALPLPKA